ncbi:MAG: hypothetical protein V4672_18735 [Verrucomicrobiota bacterium]
MNTMKSAFKILLGLTLLLSLGFCFFYKPGPVWKDGSYQVYQMDGGKRLGLYSDPGYFGLIPEVVVAAGSNKEWVVAEQNAKGERRFYIIRKPVKNEFPDDPEGPFTLDEYNKKVITLGLPPFSWRDPRAEK